MTGQKKTDLVSKTSLSTKVQESFDAAFSGIENNDFKNRDNQMTNANQNGSSPKIDLDLDGDLEDIVGSPEENGTELTIDFEYNEELNNEEIVGTQEESDANSEGFSLEGIDNLDMDFENATQKTIVFDAKALVKDLSASSSNKEESSNVNEKSLGSTADMMSKEESKANIESTIKDILRPKFDATKEIDFEALARESKDVVNTDESEDTVLDFSHTASSEFLLNNILGDEIITASVKDQKTGKTGEFTLTGEELVSFVHENESDLTSDFSDEHSFDVNDENHIDDFLANETGRNILVTKIDEEKYSKDLQKDEPYKSVGLGTEDSIRYQSTIRQLREEREDILLQVKNLKIDSREFEQDNLSLKASLDEAKIEISILRKRQMVELEDMKYRLTISEEKKALADERARQADLKREKLEQKVRIDFNQVKQREKELESKLEMLSMDVDSQVQSRDQKILELRRKIDALEFNMENTSIKEQKSLDDKRKLEDRLNKLMKTLRNSIKNLEDDIDLVQDDDHKLDKN